MTLPTRTSARVHGFVDSWERPEIPCARCCANCTCVVCMPPHCMCVFYFHMHFSSPAGGHGGKSRGRPTAKPRKDRLGKGIFAGGRQDDGFRKGRMGYLGTVRLDSGSIRLLHTLTWRNCRCDVEGKLIRTCNEPGSMWITVHIVHCWRSCAGLNKKRTQVQIWRGRIPR